jgi:hypothetical protein
MSSWLAMKGQPLKCLWTLGFSGTTVVGGLECFASESTIKIEAARLQACCLSEKAGCVGVALPEAYWNRNTRRVLLLPPPG